MSDYNTKNCSEKNLALENNLITSDSEINQKLELINHLKENYFFEGLNNEDFNLLKKIIWIVSFKSGDVIAQQGKTGEGIYFILQGEVSVNVRKLGSPKKWITNLKKGNFFGEVSLLTGNPYNATIAALEDTVCAFVRKDLADAFGLIFFDTYFKFMSKIIESMHLKVKDTLSHIKELSASKERLHTKVLKPITKTPNFDFVDTRNYFNKNYRFINKLENFTDFSDEDVQRVLVCMELKFIPKDEILFSQGDESNKCYLVFTGALQTFFTIKSSKVKIQVFGPGELVGQFALFSDQTRELSCIVKESSILLSLDASCLEKLKNNNPYLLKKLFDVVVKSCALELTTVTRQILRLETEIW